MDMILQPNSYSCMLASACMVIGCDLAEGYNVLGHDGSETIRPHLPTPYSRRGFDQDEIIDLFMAKGLAPVTITAESHSVNLIEENGQYVPDYWAESYAIPGQNIERFRRYLAEHSAVICGQKNGKPHAVAWDRNIIFDPCGFKYALDQFNPLFAILNVGPTFRI